MLIKLSEECFVLHSSISEIFKDGQFLCILTTAGNKHLIGSDPGKTIAETALKIAQDIKDANLLEGHRKMQCDAYNARHLQIQPRDGYFNNG